MTLQDWLDREGTLARNILLTEWKCKDEVETAQDILTGITVAKCIVRRDVSVSGYYTPYLVDQQEQADK
jgi:hypothetical protein